MMPWLLAQPAASAIASYDGEALAGRGVVEAPEQRGEHSAFGLILP
jgi:hypothetical protein